MLRAFIFAGEFFYRPGERRYCGRWGVGSFRDPTSLNQCEHFLVTFRPGGVGREAIFLLGVYALGASERGPTLGGVGRHSQTKGAGTKKWPKWARNVRKLRVETT